MAIKMTPHRLIGAVTLIAAVLVAGCGAQPVTSPSVAPIQTAGPSAITTASPSSTAPASPRPRSSPTDTSPPATLPPATSPPVASSPPPSPITQTEWIGPEQIAARNYGDLSLVIDEDGVAHAAAQLNGAIFYLTNASGRWTRERLSSPGRGEGDGWPSIARDDDGSLAVAFSRASCGELLCTPGELYLVRQAAAAWSEPAALGSGGMPSLQAHDGRWHIAYTAAEGVSDAICAPGTRAPVRYMVVGDNESSDVRVARHGEIPILRLAADGTPHVLFSDYRCEFLGSAGLWYAVGDPTTGTFNREPVPDTSSRADRLAAFALDPADRPHILFWHFREDDGDDETYYMTADADGWSRPERVATRVVGRAIEVDATGTAHMLALGSEGTFYMRSSDSDVAHLSAEHTWSGSGAALALDAAGRPHVLFVIGDPDEDVAELWYGIGPNR